jgi:hypothetical protein
MHVSDTASGSLTQGVVTTVRSLLLGLAVCVVIGVSAAPANAAFGIASFGGAALGPDGERLSQAGAHPDVVTDLAFTSKPGGASGEVQDENLKDLRIDLPKGLVGNPQAVTECDPELMAGERATCPLESQVGTVAYNAQPNQPIDPGNFKVALYNVRPPRGVAARLAFNVSQVVTNIDAKVQPGPDFNLSALTMSASQTLQISRVRVTLWGNPADSSHDDDRGACRELGAPGPCVSSHEPIAFMISPTQCTGEPLETTMVANSWQNPTVYSHASFKEDFDGDPTILEGCNKLGFAPTVGVSPTSTAPDAPTGLDVEITSPQNIESPGGLANAHLKDVTVTLPDGMTINPASADGLAACSDTELGLGSSAVPTCGDAARIGTVTATSPILAEKLSGGVFLRSQASDDPASGEMFRMALVVKSDERGVLVKLAGAIRVNPDTGRIVTEFKNNPQLPVDHISLKLKAGSRAPLVNPATCGTKTVDVDLTSWAGHAVNRTSTFTIPCTAGLGGFAPAMQAGTKTPRGGAFSPFALGISKPDGDSALTGLRMVLPEGLTAKIAGNLNTQVGTALVSAGPGSTPFELPGQVFLEGPYQDAPFSLKVVVPAKAGPFDLGVVTVRQKLYVDPLDAHVTVVSDPIPTIVKGVPVRLQRLDVNIDKPNFVVNPTSCAPKSIEGTLRSDADQTATVSVRFQVGECASLDLKPSLALSLSGKGQTTDGKHPAVTAALTQPAGQANLKKVRVALPLSLALDPDNANGLCEFADGSKTTPTCPKASIVGSATARTPILDEPLNGPVYFVKNVRKDPKSRREIRTLPKLVIPLVGQNGVKLTLTGTSNVEDDQLVTTFDNIPDAPVSEFKLNINGGKGGILVVSDADICKATQVAEQQNDGQNGKAADADVYIQTPSCPLKVLSKKLGKRSATLKLGGLGAGKVVVTGKGIKKTTKIINKSTVATIIAKRTKGTVGTLKVMFLAAGAKKARSVPISLARPTAA